MCSERDVCVRAGAARPAIVILPLISCSLLLAVFAAPAGAQSAFERDRVFSTDPAELLWSEGVWANGGGPLPDCVTFPGGTTTSQDHPTDGDSLYCAEVPNAWSWTVTVPGPQTIEWGVNNFPPEYEVCAQIFYEGTRPEGMKVHVDVARDRMMAVSNTGTILYDGSFSGFYLMPREGFIFLEARRCARYVILQDGACCYPDGTCLLVPEGQCLEEQGLWLGEDVPCDPNPCPPVPVEETNWGRIKAVYR